MQSSPVREHNGKVTKLSE